MEDLDISALNNHHSYYYPSLPLSNFTDSNCTDGVPWIRDYIGSCVLDDRRYAAVMLGLMSTALSTINGLPQIYVNCAEGIPDKALSIFLILQWLAGDSLNLVGGILTWQTPVQLIYATFMVSVDVIMLVQYTFFKIKHSVEDRQSANTSIQDSQGGVNDSLPSRSYNGSVMFSCVLLWCGGFISLNSLNAARPETHVFTGRRLLMKDTFFHGTQDKIGFGLGIVSTLCYMGSRLPQIYKNFERRSTVGVSFGLFFLMILANACYGSSILLHSTDYYPVLHSMPWIVGALGMILFDLVIMGQFWMYRKNIHLLVDDSFKEGGNSEDTRPLIDDV